MAQELLLQDLLDGCVFRADRFRFFAVFNSAIGIIYHSVWNGTIGVYYLLLFIIRFVVVSAEWKIRNKELAEARKMVKSYSASRIC